MEMQIDTRGQETDDVPMCPKGFLPKHSFKIKDRTHTGALFLHSPHQQQEARSLPFALASNGKTTEKEDNNSNCLKLNPQNDEMESEITRDTNNTENNNYRTSSWVMAQCDLRGVSEQ